jgi:hypothetical protein
MNRLTACAENVNARRSPGSIKHDKRVIAGGRWSMGLEIPKKNSLE